jgi:hypothetical protein
MASLVFDYYTKLAGVNASSDELNILDGVTSNTAELNQLDGSTSATSTTLADADRVVVNDNGTMKQVALTDFETYFETALDTTSNITTVGALDSGSITSGFGTIDTGSSTITTTGLISGGSLDIDNVLINGTTIGHTDDTDLMTVADGLLTVAGEISVTTLDIGGTDVTSTAAELNLLDGVSGLVQADLTKLAAIDATAAELNIMDGDTSATSTTIADADRVVVNDAGTMKQVAVTDLSAYFDDEITAMPNLVTTAATTVGVLNSGSITSGFGTIDTGASSITTTGTITGGTLAGTLSTATQGNVTSLGTLTSLTVDSIIINGTNIGHTSDTDAIAIASSGNVTISQDLAVTGDLTISGTTTTVDSTVLTVVDPIIHLQTASGGGALGSDTNKDVGLALQYYSGSAKTAFLGFDDSAAKLTFIPDATLSSEVVSGTAGTIVADLEGDVTGDLTGDVTGDVTGDLTGDVTGNADTATALATGRTIGMTGDVVWTSASFTGSGNVTGSATIQAGSVENSMLADDAVDSDELAAGAVDLAHMSSESVDEDNLHISNAGTNGYFLQKQSGNAGGLTWAEVDTTIANDSIDSQHYAAASIDNEHLADDAVGADELASDAVVNASVASDAAIALSKLATTTASRVLETSGTGAISASDITTTELALLDGSSAGTVVNSKAVIYSGTGTVVGTLGTAAQGNITSLGTLTALTVDNVAINGSTIGHTGDTDLMTVASGILTVAGEVQMTTLDIGGTNVTSTAAELNKLDGMSGTAVGTTDTQTMTNKTLTSPVINTGVSGTAVLDEDDMATDSATQLATQQSIKAYVDTRILTEDTIAELNDTTITSASDGHFLVHTGSAWVNEAPATALASLGVTSTAAELNLLDGVSGLVQADLTKLAAIDATAAEINLIDGGTSRGTTAVASGDGILINDDGTMRMTNVDTVSTYFASHSVGGGNIVTTGALDSGSITSGFGTIDTGSSSITTSGTVSGGTLAGTLSTAAQGSVTSLGTLTTLTVDNIIINGTNIGHTSDTDAIAIASSGNVTVSQDLSVSGDLTVSGTTTTVDSTVLTVVDPIIHLQTATGGGDLSSDTNKDVGLALQYHNGSAAKTAFLGYDDSAGKLTFIPDATLSSEVVSGTAGTIVADLEGTVQTAAQGSITSLGTLTALTVDNVAIDGATIGHTSDTDLMTLASGALTLAGTLTVGVNDTGHDVKFFGATATNGYMLWDESTDDLILGSASKIGIGTTTPLCELDVSLGGGSGSGIGQFNWSTSASYGGRLRLGHANHATVGNDTAVDAGDVLGQITFEGTAGDIGSDPFWIGAAIKSTAAETWVENMNSVSEAGSYLTFHTTDIGTPNLDERVRITDAGNVGINTDTPASKLDVRGTVQVGVDNTGHDVKFFGATSGNYFSWDESADEVNMVGTIKLKEQADAHADTAAFGQIWVNTATPNELYFTTDAGDDIQLTSGTAIAATPGGSTTQVQYNNSGAFAGHSGLVYASGTGTLSATVLTETSDRTYKENITNYNSNEALQAVMALQSHRYSWKESGIEEIGLIADEVQDVLPEMVHVDADSGVKGLKYTKMTAVLLEALKEQQIQIEELKSKINYKN